MQVAQHAVIRSWFKMKTFLQELVDVFELVQKFCTQLLLLLTDT